MHFLKFFWGFVSELCRNLADLLLFRKVDHNPKIFENSDDFGPSRFEVCRES